MNSVFSKIKPKFIFALLFLTFLLYALVTAIEIWRYGSLDAKDLADAEVAIVLGAATDGINVSPVFRERINHGIWLYEQGYVDKILLTGGVPEGNSHSDAYAALQYALLNNVPKEDILLEEESTVTQENLMNAKNIMEENGYTKAIIVSDPLHMKRAMLLAHHCGLTAFSSPTPTTMYRSLATKLPFLARETALYIGYRLYGLFF